MDGVNNSFKVNQSGDTAASPIAKQAKSAQQAFNPDANVSNPSTQVGMLHAKQTLNSSQPAEIAAIDMTRLDPARLKGFQERIENAVLRQEERLADGVKTIAPRPNSFHRSVVVDALLAI